MRLSQRLVSRGSQKAFTQTPFWSANGSPLLGAPLYDREQIGNDRQPCFFAEGAEPSEGFVPGISSKSGGNTLRVLLKSSKNLRSPSNFALPDANNSSKVDLPPMTCSRSERLSVTVRSGFFAR